MSPSGTAAYEDLNDLPPLVTQAVRLARREGDAARMHWLTHPGLDAAELRLAPDLAALVATRRWPTP